MAPRAGRSSSNRSRSPGIWSVSNWLGPLVAPLSTAGLVVVLVIFMLLERQDLRGRVIGIVGHGHLAVTTKALDETAARVSRQLLMQTVVNLLYGVGVLIGLTLIGVPYALLWAALGAALRFIPYLGPLLAASAPIAVALASLSGWTKPLLVMALFAGLELFTNLVLETVLYAGAVGVSQVALLIAVAFWTWLWGSLGLLLATPLTVCLVVLGKHVRGLGFLTTLMADQPALAGDKAYYQRLLARDQDEAAEMLERHIKEGAPESVYDALLLPALNYAERDVAEERLEPEEEQEVIVATRELVRDTAAWMPASAAETVTAPVGSADTAPLVVLGVPANGNADEAALRMLEQLVSEQRVRVEVTSPRLLTGEILALLEERDGAVICIADLPPSPPSRTRYLVKKLRATRPGLHIVVGRWAPPELADDQPETILAAGANHVAATLIETRDYLTRFAQHQPQSHLKRRTPPITPRSGLRASDS